MDKLPLNQETMDILVANVIPTTKYFESRFDHMQYQIDEIKNNQLKFEKNMDRKFEKVDERFKQVDETIKDLKTDIDKRFEKVDERFKQVDEKIENFKKDVDQRFEKVDRRFEQVDQRFQSLEDKIVDLTLEIKELSKRQETTIRDYIIERDRFYDKKFANLRNFNIAIITLISGLALKIFGVLDKLQG